MRASVVVVAIAALLVLTPAAAQATYYKYFCARTSGIGLMYHNCELLCQKDPDVTITNNGDRVVRITVEGQHLTIQPHHDTEIIL